MINSIFKDVYVLVVIGNNVEYDNGIVSEMNRYFYKREEVVNGS